MNDSVQSAAVGGPALRVDLRVTIVDKNVAGRLIALSQLGRQQNASVKRVYMVMGTAMWLVAGLLNGSVWALHGLGAEVLVVAIVAVLLSHGWLERRVARFLIDRADRKLSLTPFSLTFTADAAGFVIEGSNSTIGVRWPGVVEIEDTRDYVLLFLLETDALYLPKRDIEPRYPVAEFVEQLRTFRCAA